MRIIETVDIPIDKIVKNYQIRLDKEELKKLGIEEQKIKMCDETKKETIDGMAKSFDKSGLLNSVIVREHDGKYQLIAGNLRIQASQIAGKKEISARIVEASDFEARIISIVENYHRQDLLDIEKEKAIYDLWIDEMKLFSNNKRIMSGWTGIPYDTLKTILRGGEEKDIERRKEKKEQSQALINATAKDLKMTRRLEKIDSEMRRELLKAKVEKKIELGSIVKAIKSASDNNAPKEVLIGIARLVSEKKLNPHYAEDFAKTVTQIPEKEEQKQLVENIKKEETVDIYKLKNFVDTYTASPPDIQKKMMEKKIDIEEAKIVNKFPTKEQRDQVLEERKKISEIKEKELIKHTEIRMKQAEEIQQDGYTKSGNFTKMDLDKMRKEYYNGDDQVDKRTIDSYHDVMFKTKLFQAATIKNMRLDENKRTITEIIWHVYEHCYTILVELGEIKVIGNINPRTSPVHPKRLWTNNIKSVHFDANKKEAINII